MKAFWHKTKNIGDTLTPIIIKHFTGEDAEFVDRETRGKLIGIGSIMSALRPWDIVWGTGILRENEKYSKELTGFCKFLAVRGKLTEKILGVSVGVYGDPALLLPLIYNPKIEKKKEIGFIPHYIERDIWKRETKDYIDVLLPWKEFIDKILECQTVVSSSLHGIIIAEAYGIPATWMKGSEKILGDGFKFRDYLTGTGREEQGPGKFPPIKNLVEIQANLINSLMQHYGRN